MVVLVIIAIDTRSAAIKRDEIHGWVQNSFSTFAADLRVCCQENLVVDRNRFTGGADIANDLKAVSTRMRMLWCALNVKPRVRTVPECLFAQRADRSGKLS